MKAMLYGYRSFVSKKNSQTYLSLSFVYENPAQYNGLCATQILCLLTQCTVPLQPSMFQTANGGFRSVPIDVEFDPSGRVVSVVADNS